MSTPYMSLTLPTPGVTKGPDYAANINTAFTVVDSHNHIMGAGRPISAAALDINADLPLNGNKLQNAGALFLANLGQKLPTSNAGCLYLYAGDLYYNNTLGNQVPITIGGTVAGTPGTITGMTAGASATYVPVNSTFVFQSQPLTAASIDAASLLIRAPLTAGSNAVLLQAPTLGVAAPGFPGTTQFTLTLPSVPASLSYVTIDTSGTLSGSVPVALLQQSLCPPGSLMPFAGASAPTGWLLCDGRVLSRAAYPILFTAIGLAWQTTADGTQFNIPNLVNRALRGAGAATDGNGGDTVALGAYQGDGFGRHGHSVPLYAMGGVVPGGAAFPIFDSSGSTATTVVGGNETRPKAYGVNYIIKT